MIYVVNKYKHNITNNDIYIGRGSPLGNPFTSIKNKLTKAKYICETREESIKKYEIYLRKEILLKNKDICKELNNIYLREKNGFNTYLICFCKPKKCHGDIIKKIIYENINK